MRWFGVARTLAEQMQGLEPALEETRGKTVLDLGCAEGLISREFLKAGAREIIGLDYNVSMIKCASGLNLRSARFVVHDMNISDLYVEALCASDIVLALAVFHKLRDPAESVRKWSKLAGSLLVIRLPRGSIGTIFSKHFPEMKADVRSILPDCGFSLDKTLPGPRGELVMYWRRLGNR